LASVVNLKLLYINLETVTPAPYPVVEPNRQVRSKLQQESRDVKRFWIPAFPGMTFLEVDPERRFFILPSKAGTSA